MAEKEYSIPELREELAKGLKESISAFEQKVAEIRAAELRKSQGRKLSKAELCPLCGNADKPGCCTCLKKNATMGYGQGMGAPGTAAALKAEDLCKDCNQGHGPDPCKGKIKLDKNDGSSDVPVSNIFAMHPKYRAGGTAPFDPKKVQSMAAADPASIPPAVGYIDGKVGDKSLPGLSMYTKLTRQKVNPQHPVVYVHDGLHRAHAAVAANRPMRIQFNRNDELTDLRHACDPKKRYTNTEHDGVLPGDKAPKEVKREGSGGEKIKKGAMAPTSVAQANKEMGGFKSIASNPTAMPKLPGHAGPKATPVTQANKEMGGFKSIASNPTAMPKLPGMPKPAAAGAAPAMPKPAAPKMPGLGKSEKLKKAVPMTGIAAASRRSNAQPPMPSPAEQILGGRKPPGKVNLGRPALPGMTAPKKSVALATPAQAQENKVSDSVVATKPMAPVNNNAAVPSWIDNPQTSATEAQNLKADKRAGGVGFLNALVAKFKRPAMAEANATWAGLTGAGAHPSRTASRVGASQAALARSEKPIQIIENLRKSIGNCVLCNKSEHPGHCK